VKVLSAVDEEDHTNHRNSSSDHDDDYGESGNDAQEALIKLWLEEARQYKFDRSPSRGSSSAIPMVDLDDSDEDSCTTIPFSI
jgi:hypothetical protein